MAPYSLEPVLVCAYPQAIQAIHNMAQIGLQMLEVKCHKTRRKWHRGTAIQTARHFKELDNGRAYMTSKAPQHLDYETESHVRMRKMQTKPVNKKHINRKH